VFHGTNYEVAVKIVAVSSLWWGDMIRKNKKVKFLAVSYVAVTNVTKGKNSAGVEQSALHKQE
jgi:hypothetical protein